MRTGRPPVPIAARFWRKVDITPGCWLWTGKLDRDGYGHLWSGRRSPAAPRISYEINVGPIAAGFCVCHKCDNPQCVNPDHLFLGTNKDNIRDRDTKGRAAKGEKSPLAKLTEETVLLLREAHRLGHSAKKISKDFNLQYQLVRLIVLRRTWKHLP